VAAELLLSRDFVRSVSSGQSKAIEMNLQKACRQAGFTLMEVVISMLIMGLAFGGILVAYMQSANRAEWAGYSLAAQAQAVQMMEQFRAASWDTLAIPQVDQTTNIAAVTAYTLDIPISGTNAIWMTNYTSISTLTLATNNPPTQVKMIRVDAVWPWKGRFFTNTLITYRAPDQ
jgi:prepilin-type N-terminal cleavage/methylation domain-containing protein